jgi:hypothetical protein
MRLHGPWDEVVDDHACENVGVHVHGSEVAGMAELIR